MLEIWLYIARDNLARADSFVDDLSERFEALADFPELGSRRDDVSPGIRAFVVGDYIIFYRVSQSGIEIARVYHGARKPPTLP